MGEVWKRTNAELAHKWAVTGFEAEEQPRPEFIRSYFEGPFKGEEFGGGGAMRFRRGFYDRYHHFISHPDAENVLVFSRWASLKRTLLTIPQLLFVFTLMVSVTLCILTFRMLLGVSSQFDNLFNNTWLDTYITPAVISGLMQSVWITIMNKLYAALALMPTQLENFRTDTQFEDSLIFKTFIFQFFNSYGALFYIAFIKGQGISLYGSFGYDDPTTSSPYEDSCGFQGTLSEPYSAILNVSSGCDNSTEESFKNTCKPLWVVTDCVDDLYTQLLTYLVVKPFVLELALFGYIVPWITIRVRKHMAKQKLRKQQEAETRHRTRLKRGALECLLCVGHRRPPHVWARFELALAPGVALSHSNSLIHSEKRPLTI